MKVILQPAGNKDSRKHYADTIENKVPVKSILNFCPLNLHASVAGRYTENAAVWGVKAGANQINVGKWKRISVGDVALFAKDKHVIASAIVTQNFKALNLRVRCGALTKRMGKRGNLSIC